MQLHATVVLIIIAAAAGGAATRAFGSRSAAGAPASAEGAQRSAAPFTMTKQADAPRAFPATRASLDRVTGGGATAVVYVAGAVLRPGVYALPASARANDALHAAGGPAPNADLVAVNLAARIVDGDEIAVPLRGATDAAGAGSSVTRGRRPARAHRGSKSHRRSKRRTSDEARSSDADTSADAPNEIVDVNAASEAELETLPGVGPSLAERIVAFRDLNGPFASSDELLDVGGMTAGKVDALSPYISFR